MAKVDGPLFSLEARGKVANAMVFFPWKGLHVVRHWLIPTNPQSTLQGYVRVALKAIGRWMKVVGLTGDIHNGATGKAPAGVNWNGWLGGQYLGLNQSGGAFNTASFEAKIGEYSSLATDVLTAFKTNASSLGLQDFAMGYGYTDNIEAGCQLYFGAEACYQGSIYTTAPYDTDPASWSASDVDSFKSAH